MTDFFTADTHFGHANILKYSNRPFLNEAEHAAYHRALTIGDPATREKTIRSIPVCRDSAERMSRALIDNINEMVSASDTLYHLGDFCFGNVEDWRRYRQQIRCERIILCLGNHDKERHIPKECFEQIHPHGAAVEIESDGQHFVLNHYAMRVWNRSHHGVMHLYGHSHGSLADDPSSLSMDVGVDTHAYRPYSLREVLDVMKGKTYRPVDHHGSQG